MLKDDIIKHNVFTRQLQDDLEIQKSKNNVSFLFVKTFFFLFFASTTFFRFKFPYYFHVTLVRSYCFHHFTNFSFHTNQCILVHCHIVPHMLYFVKIKKNLFLFTIIASYSVQQELRTKNWKVMEALSAAELRAKSSGGKSSEVSFCFTLLKLVLLQEY